MDKEWILHYEGSNLVAEVSSISTEILEAPNGDKSYIFESPSLNLLDVGKCNVFVYPHELHMEWMNADKKLVKSISIPGQPKIWCYNGILTFCVKLIKENK